MFETSEKIHCVFFSLEKGNYDLFVTMNLVQFIQTNIQLSVVPALQIIDVEPQAILRNSPN